MDYKKLLDKCFDDDQLVIKTRNFEKINEIFEKNTKILKELINEYGILKLIDDEKYFNRVWLIVQHSDHDSDFQLQFLGAILPLLKEKSSLLGYGAYLIDRILTGRKVKQVYATQFQGEIKIPKTFSEKDLKKLRERVGMETIEEYINRMKEYSNQSF